MTRTFGRQKLKEIKERRRFVGSGATRAETDLLISTIEQLWDAIDWACGEGDSDFYSEYEREQRGLPIYWWRNELRRRAALSEAGNTNTSPDPAE